MADPAAASKGTGIVCLGSEPYPGGKPRTGREHIYFRGSNEVGGVVVGSPGETLYIRSKGNTTMMLGDRDHVTWIARSPNGEPNA